MLYRLLEWFIRVNNRLCEREAARIEALFRDYPVPDGTIEHEGTRRRPDGGTSE